MSSLSVDKDGMVASTSKSPNTFPGISRQSPTTSTKSDGGIIVRSSNRSMYPNKLEEETGTNKSGMITGFMSHTKTSKKTFYAILSDRCFELHDTVKSYKKKKAARHIFDLATCFNISHHEDAKLKTTVSIMTPDETFIFKAAEEDKTRDERATLEWLDAMVTALVPARALFLGRPVLQSEFFEYCWDVTLVAKPRIRKPAPNTENFENICTKRPEMATRHRLGLYPHTIILCKMGTQPAFSGCPKSGMPPFKTENFIEIQRQFVASFGFQEKYFIMRIGRAAATGMCEIWAQCESEEVAMNIYTRLNEIIGREAGKKKHQQQPTSNPTHQLLGSPQNTSKEASMNSLSEVSNSSKNETTASLPEVPSSSSLPSRKSILRKQHLDSMDEEELPPHLGTQKVVFNRSAISAKSIDQAILRDITMQEQKAQETQRAHTIGGQSASTTGWLNVLRRGNSQKKEDKNKTPYPFMSPVVEWAKHRASLASGNSAVDDETEDSGGTLKVVDYEEQDSRLAQTNFFLVNGLPHEKLLDTAFDNHSYNEFTYGSYGHRDSISSSSEHSAEQLHIRKRQMTIGSDSGKGEDLEHDATPDDSSSIAADESSLSDVVGGCPRHFDEACSTASSLSADHPDKASTSSGSVSHLLPPQTTEQQRMEDMRSYVSDSSDSCYSSINANPYQNLRALSFSNNRSQIYEMMQPSKFAVSNKDTKYSAKIVDEAGSVSTASTDGIQLGEEAASTAPGFKSVRIQELPSTQFLTPKEDLRKRAFSLGSKSWIARSFRRLSNNQNRSPAGSKASSIAGDTESCNESVASHYSHPESKNFNYSTTMHGRSDSIDSSVSHPASRKVSSASKKKLGNDLVEVNFSPPPSQSSIIAQYNAIGTNRHSSNSVDSPARSRASSFATHRSNNSGKNSVSGDVRKSIDQEEPIAEVQEPRMSEVRCFIQSGDDDIMNILMGKDTASLYSVKNEQPQQFETIEENCSSPANSRASSRMSRRSLEPNSPTESVASVKDRHRHSKEPKIKLQPPIQEVNYATICSPQMVKAEERKVSMPATKKLQKETVRKTASQEHS